MTAFNTSQLEEEHQDGVDNRLRGSSSDAFSFSSLDSVSLEKTRLHICRCFCNKTSSGGAEEKLTPNACSRFSSVCSHHTLNSEKLSDNSMSEQEVLCFLNYELEQERSAAETAANEAISMILRLQVEKAALQMEARHYQELFEARTLYDEETISQLKDIISSQEADKAVLEREIDECKQALHMLTEYMQDQDREAHLLEDKGGCKMNASAPSVTHKIMGAVSKMQAGKGRLSLLPIKENIDRLRVHSVKGAQQLQLAPFDEFKEEAKTKHVVSMGHSIPLPNSRLSDIASRAYATSYLGTVEHEFRTSEYEVNNMVCSEKWADNVIRECWLGILIQLSSLQNRIWSLGFSKVGAHLTLDNYQGYVLKYKDGLCTDTGQESLCAPCLQNLSNMEKSRFLEKFLPQSLDTGKMALDSCLYVPCLKNIGEGESLSCACCKDFDELQPENAVYTPIDLWSEVIAIIDSCLVNLEEKFASFQSRLHALEVARRTMVDAANTMNKNKRKLQDIMLKASNMLKEFLFLTGLGCDVLDILHKLMTDLAKASNLGEAKSADIDLSSQPKIYTVSMQDSTLTAGEELLEKASSLSQGDSPQSSCSTISKLSFLWSSSLEWLSNEKCRAETAFSGWDHV